MTLSKEERKRQKTLAKAKKLESKIETAFVAPVVQNSVTVMCVKFGAGYGKEYVEKLRNMVSRHLTVPYEFVCLTDDQHPIHGVRSIVQKNGGYGRQWWHKLHMFDQNLPVSGRILYLDLDVVVHANINKLVSDTGNTFYGIKDFNRKFHTGWKSLNSSVMSWVHGSQHDLYAKFQESVLSATRLHGDQDFIWKHARDRIKFWPDAWIQSYKWEIRRREELIVRNGQRGFKTVRDNVIADPECSVAVFHGNPNPADVQDKFVVDNWQ